MAAGRDTPSEPDTRPPPRASPRGRRPRGEAAVAEERIPTAPTRNAAKSKVIRGDVEVFADDEVKAVIAAAAGHRFEALFLVAAGTGAREGELLALEDGDFDLTAGTVRITKMLGQGKGGHRPLSPKSRNGVRTLSLPAFALAAVRCHLDGRAPGRRGGSEAGGYMEKTNFIRRDWGGLVAAAGIKYRKFHTLRHTHASRLLAAGVDPTEVAKRIGDKSETVMRTYAHWINTAAKVEAIYGNGKQKARSIDRAS